jgi:hypothetical protein
MQADAEKRKKLVWEIERKLVEDVARPVIFYPRGATCRNPALKGLTIMVNSIYNGWRYEDTWFGSVDLCRLDQLSDNCKRSKRSRRSCTGASAETAP